MMDDKTKKCPVVDSSIVIRRLLKIITFFISMSPYVPMDDTHITTNKKKNYLSSTNVKLVATVFFIYI